MPQDDEYVYLDERCLNLYKVTAGKSKRAREYVQYQQPASEAVILDGDTAVAFNRIYGVMLPLPDGQIVDEPALLRFDKKPFMPSERDVEPRIRIKIDRASRRFRSVGGGYAEGDLLSCDHPNIEKLLEKKIEGFQATYALRGLVGAARALWDDVKKSSFMMSFPVTRPPRAMIYGTDKHGRVVHAKDHPEAIDGDLLRTGGVTLDLTKFPDIEKLEISVDFPEIDRARAVQIESNDDDFPGVAFLMGLN